MSCFTAVKYFITTTMCVVCVHIAYFISSYIWQIVENYTRCAYHMSLPSLPRSLAFQCFNLEHNQVRILVPHLWTVTSSWSVDELSTPWAIMSLYTRHGSSCYTMAQYVIIYKTLCISELWKLLIFTPVLYLI